MQVKKWNISKNREQIDQNSSFSKMIKTNAFKDDIVNEEFKGEKNKFVRRNP